MNKFKLKLNKIPEDRNYWFVRTNDGKYFQNFYFKNFISTEYNEVPVELVKNNNKKVAMDVIKEEYPKHGNPGLIYTHLNRFINEMKAGDIVLVPSAKSEIIAFGKIIDDNLMTIKNEDEINFEEDSYFFKYKRKIKWLNHFEKENIDIYLMKLLNSHLTISNANNYSNYIDRTLYNFFKKGDQYFFNLYIQKQDDIPAIYFSKFLTSISNVIENSSNKIDIEYDILDLNLKTNVNSPGILELSGKIATVLPISLAIVGILGGEIEVKGLKLQTEGLIEKLIKIYETINKENSKIEDKQKDFKKLNQNIKELEKQMKNLQIDLKQIKEKNDITQEKNSEEN